MSEATPEGTKHAENKQGRISLIPRTVKADTAKLIVNGTDNFPEDVYVGTYMAAGTAGFLGILEPFYKPGDLQAVCQQNNTLMQCIEAMEVNIDGTGHTIELKEGFVESESEQKMLEDFFNEPYPGKSMVAVRRQLRRDLEQTGNGYLEVIRNVQDEVVLLNNIEPTDFRLIRLDDPVPVVRNVVRAGRELQVTLRARERKFVQIINGQKIYFREFGSSRRVNRETGDWAVKGAISFDKEGSEILHFMVNKEARTPYGAPRWLNQLPSALGSRKAEEFNLEFFDSGGLPPVLVVVQGGYLGETVKEELEAHLRGGGHRAAVVEAISSSGSLDSTGTVQVRVERFGSERQSDAMFQQYDKNCEEHIRSGFRLPPMFVGKAQDYNFATAKTGYMVAEAQVFGPERSEFDATLNSTVVKALGAKNYVFKSKPVTLVDADIQLRGLQLIATQKATDNEEIVSVTNEITGLSIEYKEPPAPPDDPNPPFRDPLTNLPYSKPVDPMAGLEVEGAPFRGVPQAVIKYEDASALITLATLWSSALGLIEGANPMSPSEKEGIASRVAKLEGPELAMFNQIMVSTNLSLSEVDSYGLMELAGCATKLS
jgi:PBSX family phage portal protein